MEMNLYKQGGWIVDGHTIGYVGKVRDDSSSHSWNQFGWGRLRTLTDWHGNEIGICQTRSSWLRRHPIGSLTRMYQIYAWINGVKYTGRGLGEGMSVRLRRCKKQ
jgi:hypothetical protein